MKLSVCICIALVALVGATISPEIEKNELAYSAEDTEFILNTFVRPMQGLKVLAIRRSSPTTINEYVDFIFQKHLTPFLKSKADPLTTDNLTGTFKFKIWFVTHKGSYNLKNGQLNGLSTLSRTGNADLSYNAGKLRLKIPIFLKKLVLNYGYYLVKVSIFHASGKMTGSIEDINIYIDVEFDLFQMKVTVNEAKVTSTGKMSAKSHGSALDWLVNHFAGKLLPERKGDIIKLFNDEAKAKLNEYVATLNKILQNILP